MDLHAFTNRLKALRFIERADVAGIMDDDREWVLFREMPVEWMISADDEKVQKLWNIVERPFTTILPPETSAEFVVGITSPAEPKPDLVAAGRRYAAEMVHKSAHGRLINHAKANQDFVAQVARMTTDAEMDGDMSGDDAVTTLSGLIEEARSLTKEGDAA